MLGYEPPFRLKKKFINNLEGREQDIDDGGPQLIERDIYEYEKYLGPDAVDVQGKIFLNIGCGYRGIYEKNAVRNGAIVYALSPYFAQKNRGGRDMLAAYTRGVPRGPSGKKGELYPVAAFAEEELPLADSSVDRVLALYSVPLYIHTGKNGEQADQAYQTLFSEIIRVLKSGGHASLYPIFEEEKGLIECALGLCPIHEFHFISIPQQMSGNFVRNGEDAYRLEIVK